MKCGFFPNNLLTHKLDNKVYWSRRAGDAAPTVVEHYVSPAAYATRTLLCLEACTPTVS